MKRRLFVKKVIETLITVLAPLLIFGAFSVYLTHLYSVENIKNDHDTALMQMNDTFSMLFDDLDSLHTLFATKINVRVGVKAALNSETLTLENSRNLTYIKNTLSSLTNTKEYLKNIHLYFINENGRYISDDEKVFSLVGGSEPWLKSFSEAQASASRLQLHLQKDINPVTGREEEELWVWRPILATNAGRTEGMIAFSMKTEYLRRMLAQLLPDSMSSAAIYTPDGEQILYAGIQGDTLLPAEFDRLLKTENRSTETDLYRRIAKSEHGLIYVTTAKQKEARLLPASMLLLTVNLAAFCLLLSLLIGILIARREYRGLKNIEKTLAAYEDGQTPSHSWDKRETEYSNIMRSAISAFLQKNYLQVQLESKSYQMRILELMALQTQINPHFLYNTLNSIQWKCIALTGGPNTASEMIENLSSIFSYSLENSEESVLLERELKYVECYVEIEKQRFSGDFSVEITADSEAKQCRIMKMLIQPVLENALRHGLNRHKGHIYIQCETNESQLKITVQDNGQGIAPEQLSLLRERLNHAPGHFSRHIGLLNTQKRIRLAYGSEYGLQIESREHVGTRVVILLPKIREEICQDHR